MTDTKQPEEHDRFKAYFEQNLLDGDKLDDSGHTMLQADEVFDVVSDYITAAETAARIDELEKLGNYKGNYGIETQLTYDIEDRLTALTRGGA